MRRMSSTEEVDSDKVVASGDLAYYASSSSPNNNAPAAIALPAQTASGWTQADLEHAAIGQYYLSSHSSTELVDNFI